MSQGRDFLNRIRTCLGGFERAAAQSSMPQWADQGKGQHRFFCGNPRDTTAGGGFTFRDSGYTVTFELYAEETDGGWDFRRFSVHLLNVGEWGIFFHKDPQNARWPDHPETHIQFEAPMDAVQAAPFLSWRLPIGEIDPLRCLEYVAARAARPDSAGR